MTRRERRFGGRLAIAAGILFVHGVLLIVLISTRPPQRRDAVSDRVMMLVQRPAVHPARLAPSPPPADPVTIIATAPTIALTPAVRVSGASMPIGSSGVSCAIERAVADAIANDAHARAALNALGPVRAATGAVMVWNGGWIVPPERDDAAKIAILHPIMLAAIAGATADCRSTELYGPRLIAVSGLARPVLLAIGSGRWRWRDLESTAG